MPLSFYCQGRYVTGKCHSLGVGIKITATRTPHKVQRPEPQVVVPSGTGVLYFVIVARLTQVKKRLSVQALQPIKHKLYQRGLGGKCGYGVLQDRSTVLLFVVARSPAWFVNSDAHGERCKKSNTHTFIYDVLLNPVGSEELAARATSQKKPRAGNVAQ